MKKMCSRCGKNKELDMFYKKYSSRNGYASECKACKLELCRKYRKTDKGRAVEERRRNTKKRKIYLEEYYQSDKYKERVRSRNKRYYKKNQNKILAHRKLNNLIRVGKLVKPQECFECGAVARLDAHHEDYSKPLDVVWLCRSCHLKKHKRRK